MKVFVTQGLTAIIKGVINVINYFIELYHESVLIRAIWNGIVAGFKTTFDTLGNLFGFFIDIVKVNNSNSIHFKYLIKSVDFVVK